MTLSLLLALLAAPAGAVRRPAETSPDTHPDQEIYQQALERYRAGDFPGAAEILER